MHHNVFLSRWLAAGLTLASLPITSAAEFEITIPAGDHVLAGTLTVPDGPGPYPAAVVISGSGPSNRDESLPGVALKPFARLANELEAAGIATLRYDDRGVGQSTGDFHSATSFDFADDALAALAVFADRPEIDASRVGLVGHSEGGMIAPHAAAGNSAVAFVVSLAGTAVTGYDLFADQLRTSLTALPEGERESAFAQRIHELDLVVAEDWAAVEAMLAAEPGSTPESVAQGMIYYRGWLHTFVTHDPAADWRKVEQPVLALFGGRDTQVAAALNQPTLALALEHHSATTITVLPTANHLFQAAVTGAPSEYATLPDAFVPGFAQTIADWINALPARSSK